MSRHVWAPCLLQHREIASLDIVASRPEFQTTGFKPSKHIITRASQPTSERGGFF